MKRNKQSTLYAASDAAALTFDDVLLQPAFSDILPHEVHIGTKITPKVHLNSPFLSAAMDTVTEARMAIAMAREGGLGVIHKNLGVEKQVEQIQVVKRSESGIILQPITLQEDALLEDALALKEKFNIGGIPIVDKSQRLVGILTNRDIRFVKNVKTPVAQIMTSSNLITAPKDTSLKKAEEILNKYKIEKLPIVNASGRLVGLITYRDILQVQHFPNASKDKFGRLLVAAAIGVSPHAVEHVQLMLEAGVDLVVLDSAHAHTKNMLACVKKIKSKHASRVQLLVGNIATSEAAIALKDAGADAVKVGIGPGSICTTRVVTGVGVPQLSAILNVSKALQGSHIGIVADGGVRYSGDAVKAFAAGASAVMMGSILAGTEESPGETILFEGRKFKQYRGMGSLGAMKSGSADRYFQEQGENQSKLVPEGIEGRVPYRGTVNEILFQFAGGLRSGMGYCGAKRIADLRKATFVKTTPSALAENHPHNVIITKESPNYSR